MFPTRTGRPIAVILPVYRETHELAGSIGSYRALGVREAALVELFIVVDGQPPATPSGTLRCLRAHLGIADHDRGALMLGGCVRFFSGLVAGGLVPFALYVKSPRLRRGKRFSHLLAFDLLRERQRLCASTTAAPQPVLVMNHDADTRVPRGVFALALATFRADPCVFAAGSHLNMSNLQLCGAHYGFVPQVWELQAMSIRDTLAAAHALFLVPGPCSFFRWAEFQGAVAEAYGRDCPAGDVLHAWLNLADDSWLSLLALCQPGRRCVILDATCEWELPTDHAGTFAQRRRWTNGGAVANLLGLQRSGLAGGSALAPRLRAVLAWELVVNKLLYALPHGLRWATAIHLLAPERAAQVDAAFLATFLLLALFHVGVVGTDPRHNEPVLTVFAWLFSVVGVAQNALLLCVCWWRLGPGVPVAVAVTWTIVLYSWLLPIKDARERARQWLPLLLFSTGAYNFTSALWVIDAFANFDNVQWGTREPVAPPSTVAVPGTSSSAGADAIPSFISPTIVARPGSDVRAATPHPSRLARRAGLLNGGVVLACRACCVFGDVSLFLLWTVLAVVHVPLLTSAAFALLCEIKKKEK